MWLVVVVTSLRVSGFTFTHGTVYSVAHCVTQVRQTSEGQGGGKAELKKLQNENKTIKTFFAQQTGGGGRGVGGGRRGRRYADAKTVNPKVENVSFPPSYHTLYNAVKKGVQSVKLGYAAVS